MSSSIKSRTHSVSTGLMAAVLAATPLAAAGQERPLSHIADPSVYKVLKENEMFRVVLATFKPGQRDAWHSHPAYASYLLTTCDLNFHYWNLGAPTSFAFGPTQQGTALTNDPVAAHSVENIGKSECRVVFVERK